MTLISPYLYISLSFCVLQITFLRHSVGSYPLYKEVCLIHQTCIWTLIYPDTTALGPLGLYTQRVLGKYRLDDLH